MIRHLLDSSTYLSVKTHDFEYLYCCRERRGRGSRYKGLSCTGVMHDFVEAKSRCQGHRRSTEVWALRVRGFSDVQTFRDEEMRGEWRGSSSDLRKGRYRKSNIRTIGSDQDRFATPPVPKNFHSSFKGTTCKKQHCAYRYNEKRRLCRRRCDVVRGNGGEPGHPMAHMKRG